MIAHRIETLEKPASHRNGTRNVTLAIARDVIRCYWTTDDTDRV